MSVLVDDMLTQIRAQTDETNTDNVTDSDVLQALNRAQRHTANLLSKKFEEMLWTSTTATTTAGQHNYDIPSDAFGSRVEVVEVVSNANSLLRYRLTRINNHRTSDFRNATQTDVPRFYTIQRNEILVFPAPKGNLTLHIHYSKAPEPLVVSQGRIATIDTNNNYVTVDTLGSSISTSTTGFASYLNIIDFNTGNIKRTLQVSATDSDSKQITFKSSGLTRSTVLNKTVSTSIGSDPAVDDYVCLVTGTCVPEIDFAYTDYMIQHAVIDIKKRLGESIAQEVTTLKDMEKELLDSWKGRQNVFNQRKRSRHWQRLRVY